MYTETNYGCRSIFIKSCFAFLFVTFLFSKDIRAIESTNVYFINNSFAPDSITISGTVVDDNNVPLEGVNILEKGTLKGVTTDRNGYFRITVINEASILLISFTSYISQEIVVGSKRSINVQLVRDVKLSDEVVVVGYGTMRKSDLTGSLTSITSSTLNQSNLYRACSTILRACYI